MRQQPRRRVSLKNRPQLLPHFQRSPSTLLVLCLRRLQQNLRGPSQLMKWPKHHSHPLRLICVKTCLRRHRLLWPLCERILSPVGLSSRPRQPRPHSSNHNRATMHQRRPERALWFCQAMLHPRRSCLSLIFRQPPPPNRSRAMPPLQCPQHLRLILNAPTNQPHRLTLLLLRQTHR